MYLCDIHTHSLISHDSPTPLIDMAEAAISAGLQELCPTDHCDLLDKAGKLDTFFDWPAAKLQYHEVLSKIGDKLKLRLGIELGSAAYCPDAASSILAGGGDEVDFVLGSLHNWIGSHENIEFYTTDFTNDPALCREAMENCLAHTRTLVYQYPQFYDSLAHIIYPIRYMVRDGQQLDIADYEEQIRDIFAEVARSGHALEVNTCRGNSISDWVPLLRWFKECGGELVTVGSDAHYPKHMAAGIPDALELIQAAGFRGAATYEKRKPVLHFFDRH